jgi:hypothetical protein
LRLIVKLKVMNPVYIVKSAEVNTPRLDTLNGKTICEIAATGATYWRADKTFPVIRELIKKRYPEAEFITYTEFPDGHAQWYPVPLDEIGGLLKGKGCDALLLGNGG